MKKKCNSPKSQCYNVAQKYFSHSLELFLLNCVCISFMCTTLKFSIIFWSLRIVLIFSLFIFFLFNLNSRGYAARNIGLFFFSLVCCVLTIHSLHFLLVVATLILLQRISLKKFIEVNAFYALLTLLLLIPLSNAGLIENNIFKIKTGDIKSFYCFDNPNRMGSFLYASVIFVSLWLINKKHLLLAYLFEFVLSFYIYIRTGARSPSIAIIFQFIVLIVLRSLFIKTDMQYRTKKYMGILKKIIVFVFSFSGVLFLLFSILLARYYYSGIMLAIDLLLGRGRYIYDVIESYSIKNLFLGFNFSKGLPLDNSYIYILCCTNIFAYGIFSFFIFKALRKVSSIFFVLYGPFIAAFLFYGTTESLLGYYSYIALVFYFLLLKSARGEL